MEQADCSETSAYKIQTPGNYPEESKQHSEHGKSLKSRRNLLHNKDMLHNLCLLHSFTFFCSNNTHVFHNLEIKIETPPPSRINVMQLSYIY